VLGGGVSFGRTHHTADRDAYLAHARLRSFERRVEQSRDVLRKAAAVGPLVVSVSWGKDSTALAHLALETLGRVPMLHMSSPYALPGWERVYDYFAARTDVTVLPAERSLAEYLEWCERIGLPHERTANVQSRVVQEIKRDRGGEWAREHGYAVQVLGLRASESVIRRMLLRRRGLLYQLSTGDWRAQPLAWWSAQDTWAYLFSREVPYHPLYDHETHGQTRETLRNTGWLSTDGAEQGRIAWLQEHYPAQYRQLAAEFPRIRQLR
jgi:phosphoadenosine phosphosulfate reductase